MASAGAYASLNTAGDDARGSSFPDRGPSAFVVTTATFVLASVFVAARTVTRTYIVRRVSWDDYCIVGAWLIALGLGVAIIVGTTKGLGRHDINIDPDNWDSLRRTEYVFSVLYNPALMATKTSILIFYLRLSKNTERVLRLASWVVLVIVNLAGTVLTLLNIFQCRPIDAAFDMYQGAAFCIPILTEFICAAPVNIVTDLAILALPLPVLTGMRLPFRQKVILILTFTLGVFVTIVDVVRIYYLQQAVNSFTPTVSSNPAATFGDQPEFAWNAALSFMWSAVEVNVGIMCACIPTLKPLIIRILPAMIVDPDGTRRASNSLNDTKSRTQSDRNGSGDSAQVPPLTNGNLDKTTPPEPAYDASGPGAPLSAMEFLTTPDMDMTARRSSSGATMNRQNTAMTNYTNTSNMENAVYFGFVNIRKPKSLIRTSVRDSWKYCSLVAVLFFLWGFSYGLLNTLNSAIAVVADMSTTETLGLTSIYFGAGYFLGPLLVGEWVLRHDEHRRVKKKRSGSEQVGGFKATFMLGLCIYGAGTIMFWPSAVLTSFAGFMICNFVVGFGLAVLETAANPFLALCGPMDYSEMRLLWAQAIQAIGTVLSQVLAQRVFFDTVSTRDNNGSATTLIDVQWTYLAITLFSAGLALFFYYMPLPEVTDAEMEHSTRYLPVDPKKRSFFGLQLRTLTLALAVLAQWTYVAGQESMSIYFNSLLQPMTVEESTTSTSAALVDSGPGSMTANAAPSLVIATPEFLLIAHSAFAISRILTGYLAYLSPRHPSVPQPRTVLNITNACSIACAIAICALRPVTDPNKLAIPIVLFYFFEGPMWPLIYALGLRGQGSRTKRAAAYITMGASGPAFWPFVMYAIVQRGGSERRSSYQNAFILVPALLVMTGLFSLFLDLKRDARLLVDSRVGAEEQARIQDQANREMDLDAIMSTRRHRRRSSTQAIEHAAHSLGRTLSRRSTNHSGDSRERSKYGSTATTSSDGLKVLGQENGQAPRQGSLAKRLSMAMARRSMANGSNNSPVPGGDVFSLSQPRQHGDIAEESGTRRPSSAEGISPMTVTPPSIIHHYERERYSAIRGARDHHDDSEPPSRRPSTLPPQTFVGRKMDIPPSPSSIGSGDGEVGEEGDRRWVGRYDDEDEEDIYRYRNERGSVASTIELPPAQRQQMEAEGVLREQQEAQSRANSEAQSKAHSEAESRSRSRSQSQAQSQTQSQAQSRSQSQLQSRSQSGVQTPAVDEDGEEEEEQQPQRPSGIELWRAQLNRLEEQSHVPHHLHVIQPHEHPSRHHSQDHGHEERNKEDQGLEREGQRHNREGKGSGDVGLNSDHKQF